MITNSMGRDLRIKFQLWSKLKLHKRRVNQAEDLISDWLKKVDNPYIAFSGGKDSTCILDLVRKQRPDTLAVYLDPDCHFPEQMHFMESFPFMIRYPADEPFLVTLDRNPTILGNEVLQKTTWGPIKRLLAEYNFDGVCYGLRKEEDHGRKMHALTRGAVFWLKRDGIWGCQPLTDWGRNDVWGYIVSNNLSYCPVYDKMWDMPDVDQRISFWAGRTKRTYGRWAWLKRNYPELFNKLAVRFPEARSYV